MTMPPVATTVAPSFPTEKTSFVKFRPSVAKATPHPNDVTIFRRNASTIHLQDVTETAELHRHRSVAHLRHLSVVIRRHLDVALRVQRHGAKTRDVRHHETRALQALNENCRSKIDSGLNRKAIRKRIGNRGRHLEMKSRLTVSRASVVTIGRERASERPNETAKPETAARKGNISFKIN